MQISIPVEDLLKGQLHEEGWKKGEIVLAEAKPSKDKQSINYSFVIKYSTGSTVPGTEFRDIKSQFNSQAPGFMRPFLAALRGKTEGEFIEELKQEAAAGKKAIDFQWESVKGGKLQFRIQNKPREDNGQLTSKITEFAPYDYNVPF